MALPINEAEIESAPNSVGAYPPATEPITIPIMIYFFLDMVSAKRPYLYEYLKLEYPVLWTGMKSFPAEGRDKCAMYRTWL